MIKTKAPANLMLAGEHAVLHGYKALSCAVDKYLYVTIRPAKNFIVNSALGNFEVENYQELELLYVRAVLQFFYEKYQLKNGLEIIIDSEFRSDIGFGSSAAVVVALTAAFIRFLNLEESKENIFSTSFQIIKTVKSNASGADLAACVYGGIVSYKMGELPEKLQLKNFPKITPIYVGYKTETSKVVEIANKLPAIYKQLGELSEEMENLLLTGADLKDVFNKYQPLHYQLGIIDEATANLLAATKNNGAKISGSGLGDCIIACGELDCARSDTFPVSIINDGVQYE